jgi:phenylacetaldoxime dehydratase/aldoxime dehydratase
LPAGKKIAVLFVGAQGRSIEAVRQANLSELCKNSEPQLAALDYLDNAEYIDPEGYINHIAALYWSEASQFHEWRKSQAVACWRTRIRAEQGIGIWWEPIEISTERLETITFKEYRRGVSACPARQLVPTPGTGYWGAARDRIPASAHDRFEPSISEA